MEQERGPESIEDDSFRPASPRTTTGRLERPFETDVEVSFVIPCLNEAETLEDCIGAAQSCIAANGLSAEIIVADNGSTDGSQEIARRCAARVVEVQAKGYGNALMGGFSAARGKYFIMGDADRSYDFSATMGFVEKLRDGYDLVMGSRFKGRIMPGAMPWKHKWIGNPILSWLGRFLFGCRVSDFHCGLRAFTRRAFEEMNARTTGMEFASELVIKAGLKGMRITEIPITLYQDGRSRPPHLRSWRDGWRHLRFMLLLCPKWTLIIPGLILVAAGILLGAVVASGPTKVADVVLDVHTLIAASLLVLVGYQAALIGFAARIFAVEAEIGPPAPLLQRSYRVFTLEKGLIAGAVLLLAGLLLIAGLTAKWAAGGFGPLELQKTIRPMIIGATLSAVGVQTILMSLFYSMLGIRRKAAER